MMKGYDVMAGMPEQRLDEGKIRATSALDEDIRRYIEATEGDDYAEAIADDRRFDVFYHLSDLRRGILGWYDFRPDASLLEIGAEFGALTGLFCERCAKVTAVEPDPFRAQSIRRRYPGVCHLAVHTGNLQELPKGERFDYVVSIGGLETAGNGNRETSAYVEHLCRLRERLTPGGILLLAVDNRYGLKYFCGETERHTGKPFAGISGQTQGASGCPFDQRTLRDIVAQAGFSRMKFYYLLPDLRLTQLVYTDAYLPEDNLQERLILYHPDHATLVADEAKLYSDVIRNGAFPFFANSYLVECCGDAGNMSSAIYAALSTDRGREKAMATVIYAEDRVEKRPLYPVGQAYVKGLASKADALRQFGVPVLAQEWDGHALVMPKVHGEMLSSYLKHCVVDRPEEFRAIIARLWQTILCSSPLAEEASNAMTDTPSVSDRNLPWGQILQKAYIELIPLNCFYHEGDFLFFDQEYVEENYPAKYILFRALHYIYDFMPDTEKYVPLREMQETYGLTELWPIFLQEENGRFLPTVRQHRLYRQFYRWNRVDVAQMRRNALLLGLDEEYSPEYAVSDKMRRIWHVGYDLLRTFTEMCQRHGLRYYIFFGTLLGAVRHEGFIPWDDDVDVVMPRADYDKLQEFAEEFPYPYFLQTPENDPGTFHGGILRLRNSETTGIAREDFGHPCNSGIWMDIMSLDSCSEDKDVVQKQIEKIRFWQTLLFLKTYPNIPRAIPTVRKYGYHFLAKILSRDFLCKRLRQSICAESDPSSRYVAVFTSGNAEIFERSFFDEGIWLRFGDMRVRAPKQYKNCLQLSAGRDYMKFPPMSKRHPHHLGIFHPDIPYRKYNDIFFGLFDGAEGKSVILFGGGFMFEDYMKKYGRAYPPRFIVDNDENKWGKTRHGIEIQKPEYILKIPEKTRWLIICSIHYREIEKQLTAMNIHRYKVYVQEKDWIIEDEQKGR